MIFILYLQYNNSNTSLATILAYLAKKPCSLSENYFQSKDKKCRTELKDTNKILIMQTIRQYIKNYKQFAFSKPIHTPSSSRKRRINSHLLQPAAKHNESMDKYSNSDQQSNLYPRKISLPPIYQRLNKSPSIDLKGSSVLKKYLYSKSIDAGRSHRRSKTEQQRLAYKLSNRSQALLNVQQMRMRPMLKYYYHLQNIRLAEKLLVIKPSRDINRTDQKKFFKQHRHYRDQISISKGYNSIKSSRQCKRSARRHQL